VATKTHIALLPGLDGTGEMFFPIIPLLEKNFEVHVVRYSDEVTVDEYVETALAQLPTNSPVSLVAESFSGPIAIILLADKRAEFQASVLSSTFCKSPLPFLTRASNYLPEKLFSSNPVNNVLLDLFATGSNSNPDVRNQLREVVKKVSPGQRQTRIKLVSKIDVTDKLKNIAVPLLYIQATKDRIVLANSGTEIMKHAKNMKIEKVSGSHMILQTQPEKCAELIISHVTSNKGARPDLAYGQFAETEH